MCVVVSLSRIFIVDLSYFRQVEMTNGINKSKSEQQLQSIDQSSFAVNKVTTVPFIFIEELFPIR